MQTLTHGVDNRCREEGMTGCWMEIALDGSRRMTVLQTSMAKRCRGCPAWWRADNFGFKDSCSPAPRSWLAAGH
jgi:hypothetical protein